MVAYELSLIIKGVSKDKLVSVVKRTAEMILSQNSYLEKIEFLGSKRLPMRISSHGMTHSRGSYFLIHYHAPYDSKEEINDHCSRDMDIIRKCLVKKEVQPEFVCTLHEEMKPPSQRLEVSKMIKEAEDRLSIGAKLRKKIEIELKEYKF